MAARRGLLVPKAPSAAGEAGGEVAGDGVQADALLAHRVALPHGHRVVLERVEVDRQAERRADLVLPAVAAADGAGVVEVDVPALPQLGGEVAGLGREV